MATAFGEDEFEDFITCTVCISEYDTIDKKPKFLQCSHTACLACLKKIAANSAILCPLCRHSFVIKDVDTLPNNMYALKMLKLKEDRVKRETTASTSTFDSSFRQLVSHLQISRKADKLLKLKEFKSSKLNLALEKRREVNERLQIIKKSALSFCSQTQRLINENNQLLEEMALLDKTDSSSKNCVASLEGNFTKYFVLSDLLALVDNPSPDDSIEQLKLKMNKSVREWSKKFLEASDLALEYELRQKIKIEIRMFDENDTEIETCALFKNGFLMEPSDEPGARQDLMLISHAIFSFLKRQINVSLTQITGDRSVFPFSPRQAVIFSSNCYVPGQSLFILRLSSPFIESEIVIRPSSTFSHADFAVKQLGAYCYKSPKSFSNFADEAIPGEFLMMKLTGHFIQQQLSVGNFTSSGASKKPKPYSKMANEVGQVGIVPIVRLTSSNSIITNWNFLFPLQNFKNSGRAKTSATSLLSAELFGNVMKSKMMNPITVLSCFTQTERANCTLTLHSQ